MSKEPTPGTVAEFSCPMCGKETAHQVTHVSDVLHHRRCQGCSGVQAYVTGDNAGEPVPQDPDAVFGRLKAGEAVRYRTTEPFRVGQFIEHVKFGTGYVLELRAPDKMEVLFGDAKRVLLRGPGSVHAEAGDRQPAAANASSTEPDARETSAAQSTGPADTTAAVGGAEAADGSAVKCPKCGLETHTYNLRFSPGGKIVGCVFCSRPR